MTTVFRSQGVGQPILREELIDKYGKALTGRWCKPPQLPDRCDYCPLADIKPAVGYITDNTGGWRIGYCEDHKNTTH